MECWDQISFFVYLCVENNCWNFIEATKFASTRHHLPNTLDLSFDLLLLSVTWLHNIIFGMVCIHDGIFFVFFRNNQSVAIQMKFCNRNNTISYEMDFSVWITFFSSSYGNARGCCSLIIHIIWETNQYKSEGCIKSRSLATNTSTRTKSNRVHNHRKMKFY